MVKQRLAQLECSTGSPASARGSPLQSPPPSAGRARSIRRGPNSASELHRQTTSASGVVDSLVDSYRVTPVSSPLSASSGRLTTVGPSSPARSPATSTFLKPLPQTGDLFSPASRYSTDDEIVIRPSLCAPGIAADLMSTTARRPMIRLDTEAGPLNTPVAIREEQRPLPNVPVHLREEPRNQSRAISPPFCVSLRDEPRTLPSMSQAACSTSRDTRSLPIRPSTLEERDEPIQLSNEIPGNAGALGELHSKMDAILDRLRQQGRTDPSSSVDLSNVLSRLDELRTEMHNTTIQASETRSPSATADSERLNEMHVKLDALASLCQTLHDREQAQSAGSEGLPEVP